MDASVVAVDASAGGLFFQTTGMGFLAGARLAAAAANATAVIREGGVGGRILVAMAAAQDTADDFAGPHGPVQFLTALHVTIVGAGATLILYGA
jgi:hypothetical protein